MMFGAGAAWAWAGAVIEAVVGAGAGKMFTSFFPPIATSTTMVMPRPMITRTKKENSAHQHLFLLSMLESAIVPPMLQASVEWCVVEPCSPAVLTA